MEVVGGAPEVVDTEDESKFLEVVDAACGCEEAFYVLERYFEGEGAKVGLEDGGEEGNGRFWDCLKAGPHDVVVRDVRQATENVEQDLHYVLWCPEGP